MVHFLAQQAQPRPEMEVDRVKLGVWLAVVLAMLVVQLVLQRLEQMPKQLVVHHMAANDIRNKHVRNRLLDKCHNCRTLRSQ